MNNRPGRAGPLREGRNVISERGMVYIVNEDSEEGMGLVVGIGLKLRVDLVDECGGNSREQTGLLPKSTQVHQNKTRDSRRLKSC